MQLLLLSRYIGVVFVRSLPWFLFFPPDVASNIQRDNLQELYFEKQILVLNPFYNWISLDLSNQQGTKLDQWHSRLQLKYCKNEQVWKIAHRFLFFIITKKKWLKLIGSIGSYSLARDIVAAARLAISE